MLTNEKFKILIIDNNKDFNSELCLKLKQYRYDITQAFNSKTALELLQLNKNEFHLVLLNIDFDDDVAENIFEFIIRKTFSKVILLSSEDIIEKREEYFSKGILDYHLTHKRLDHTVDDILDTINTLETNKKETVLVINSCKTMCNSIYNILASRNYIVLTSLNAKDGLEMLKDYEISLLILDMEIDDIDGLSFLEGLRDMYLLNQFFVLVMSNNDSPSIVRETLKSGARDFLRKPFLYEELLLKTDMLVGASRTKRVKENQKIQIENSLKIFKELLDSTIGAMFIFEKNICINCNKEAIKLLGYGSKEDLVAKHIYDIFTDVSREHKKELLDNKTEHYFEDTIISNNSTVYQVKIHERNILIDNKNLKIIAVMDVSEVKRKEKILSHQTKMASMGEMIGNIAHQWRQPLSAISIAASGIKLNYELDIEDRYETMGELDNIVENTKFLSSTIESFQNFLKADKSIKEFDVQSALRKTLSVIDANLKTHGIEVIEYYKSEVRAIGIENELMQVFLNIINNASDILKKQSDSSIKKYIFIILDKTDEKNIITIQDNAKGIPKDIISKVFEPYFTTKHQSEGTGLGLYMTHNIIESMGGKIKVSNNSFVYDNIEYYGAKFIITLPLHA